MATLAICGIRVELTVEGRPRDLPAGVVLSAFQIVQEALTNTLKHGRFGASSYTWQDVQPRLGHTTRTCAYDRAGLGNSAASPRIHDANDEIRDVRRLPAARSGGSTPRTCACCRSLCGGPAPGRRRLLAPALRRHRSTLRPRRSLLRETAPCARERAAAEVLRA
jgi:hypothetical protein